MKILTVVIRGWYCSQYCDELNKKNLCDIKVSYCDITDIAIPCIYFPTAKQAQACLRGGAVSVKRNLLKQLPVKHSQLENCSSYKWKL